MGAPSALAFLLWVGSGALTIASGGSLPAPAHATASAALGALAISPAQGPPQRPGDLPVRRLAAAVKSRSFARDDDEAQKPGAEAKAKKPDPNQSRAAGPSAPPVFEPFGELKRFGVRIVSPNPDDEVAGRVSVRAEVVADRPSAVSAVDFLIDGRLMFSDAIAPYELLWNSGRPADHLIEVHAYGPGRQMVRDTLSTRLGNPGRGLGGFSARVERVELHVRIEGADGEPLNYGIDAFDVFENGVSQPVLGVDRVADLPLAVGLLIDHSRSMREQLEKALDAADSFVEALMTHPNDRAFILGFADVPVVFQEFTNDTRRLADAISLIDSGTYTALYDSIVAASRKFVGVDGRGAVVLLTDGSDHGSEHDLREAIAAAQRADVALYPIAVGPLPRYIMEHWVLRRLAAETGGRMFTLDRRGDPEKIYKAIEEDLRSQYRITYAPLVPGGSGEWRELDVRLKIGDDLKVRTRPGYYAQ